MFTNTSTLPNSRYTVSTRWSHCSQELTLHATGSARRPCSASTWAANSLHESILRLAITTSAPCAAKARTIARPNPRLPPVTTTTLSCSIRPLLN
ncbi:Uncharacterised protein [Mycobacteroides abscessus subsp. abscessus]|nr:Uncharacterised protein [Mycobacteroides abscessus subsp. abscessus]